jgi:hypothetical protein
VEKYCRAGQATDDNMAHALRTLNTRSWKHYLRICNTYCCSIATMVNHERASLLRYTLTVL